MELVNTSNSNDEEDFGFRLDVESTRGSSLSLVVNEVSFSFFVFSLIFLGSLKVVGSLGFEGFSSGSSGFN